MAAVSTSNAVLVGAPCWVSLVAPDIGSAQRFYSAVFGWEFRTCPPGEEFSVAYHQGAPVAGIGALAGNSVPVAWTPYFAVGDADVAATRISERCATVAVGPLSFGTGRAVLAADRDGAIFGVWEGELVPGWTVGRDTALAWLELHTRDAFDAAIFYAEVLDWATDREGSCQVAYEDEYVVLRQEGEQVARLHGGAVEAAPDPHVRPRWDVHFWVSDLDEAVAVATRLGGGVVPPVDTDGLRSSVTLRDPDGVLFRVRERIGRYAHPG
ncbi:VOC family protein [Streptomyces sp. NPDC002133]|uniref:VOC family protein n=1 Tax=Streptomyces sp. NPDC002133 TaxID=3154409 RepID=UPI00331E3DDE